MIDPTPQVDPRQDVRFAADPELLQEIREAGVKVIPLAARVEVVVDIKAELTVETAWPEDLAPRHVDMLKASGISPRVARQRGYKTVERTTDLRIKWKFGPKQARAGLVVPIWNVWGESTLAQIRPDQPRIERKKGKEKPIKYETPKGATMQIDVPPAIRKNLGDPSIPLVITEGSKKADSAVTRGLTCIALLGVDCWRGTNPSGGKTVLSDWELIALKGEEPRKVYIVFDSDVTKKKEVRAAQRRLKSFLKGGGAEVLIVDLPGGSDGSKVGLDDFFVAGSTVEDLFRLASPEVPVAASAEKLEFELTDMGNARRLADHAQGMVRHCRPQKTFYCWTGKIWEPDQMGWVERLAKERVGKIVDEVKEEKDDSRRLLLLKHATRSQQAERVRAMISLVGSEPGIPVLAGEFDANDWLLNCKNGVLDLQTGKLRPHDRTMMMTKICAADFNQEARSDLWESHLERVLPDPEVRQYFQRAIGYSLTGDTSEQKLFFAHGPTATGKSTTLEALRAVLAGYSTTTEFETFLKRQGVTGSPRNDVAALAGSRLVFSSEVNEGMELAIGLVKQLTGGDTVRARFLYQEGFEFQPKFKLWLRANHRVKVPEADDATWRRIVEIPFTAQVPEGERDPSLKRRLLEPECAAAILAWAFTGLEDWRERGLGQPPNAMREALEEYKEEMDPLREFFDECCVLGPDLWTPSDRLRKAYLSWASDRDNPLGEDAFFRRLRKRGLSSQLKRSGGSPLRGWNGIGLRDDRREERA